MGEHSSAFVGLIADADRLGCAIMVDLSLCRAFCVAF